MLCPRRGRGRPSASAALRARWARRTFPTTFAALTENFCARDLLAFLRRWPSAFAGTAKERAVRSHGARVNEEGHHPCQSPATTAATRPLERSSTSTLRPWRSKLVSRGQRLGFSLRSLRRERVPRHTLDDHQQQVAGHDVAVAEALSALRAETVAAASNGSRASTESTESRCRTRSAWEDASSDGRDVRRGGACLK